MISFDGLLKKSFCCEYHAKYVKYINLLHVQPQCSNPIGIITVLIIDILA